MNTAPIAAELSALRELVETLKEALELTRQENILLRQKIDSLVRRVFGSSSEKLDRAQLDLLLQLPISTEATIPVTAVEAPKAAVSRSRKDRAPRLPENLPVVEEVIEPEPVKASPEQWRCIGQEVSEQLDYEPARFLRRRTIRKKYVSRTDIDLAPVIAPLPECLQERSIAAPGLLAQILVSKILRPSAALSAGTDFPAPASSASAASDFGAMGGAGRRLVETGLRTDPNRGDGRWLYAGG